MAVFFICSKLKISESFYFFERNIGIFLNISPAAVTRFKPAWPQVQELKQSQHQG